VIRAVSIRRFKRFEEVTFELTGRHVVEEIHPEVIEKLDKIMEAFGL